MIDIEFLSKLAIKSGHLILKIYDTDFEVDIKNDRSPITLADKQSNKLICQELKNKYPQIPVLSEEGTEVPYQIRKDWTKFWLVDPLDGTLGFVKKNGEFTVNIALIEDRKPSFGLIYHPISNRIYIAINNKNCWDYWVIEEEIKQCIKIKQSSTPDCIRIVTSHLHTPSELDAKFDVFSSYDILKRGGALKFCALAAGEADLYPRFDSTWEWDTAAGQAIVEATGGVVVDLQGKPFTYNKPNLINGPFLAASNIECLQKMGVL